MFNLIRKDLLIQKSTFKYILIYIIFFSFIFDTLTSNTKYIMYVLISVYSLFLTAFTYDEKYRADFILNSLPLRRKDIVVSKYISVILYILLSLIISGVIGAILIFFKLPVNMDYLNMKVIVDSSLITLLIYSLILPFLFKFGQRKGRFIVSIIFFSCFGMLINLYNDMSKISNKESILSGYSIGFSSILFIICLFMFFVSAVISIKIYINKDLG